MTENVDPAIIEAAVGAKRHPRQHVGRYDDKGKTFFILHSEECLGATSDLRNCDFSLALDRTNQSMGSIAPANVPYHLAVERGFLVATEECNTRSEHFGDGVISDPEPADG